MELEKLKLEMMPRLNYSFKPAVPRGVGCGDASEPFVPHFLY